ncbi:MAG: SpoIID/LytB domain-containing protein [Coprobacter sp.]|nr:SpoIID/LytB domain-containing protein [Coprobacter sp.]
MSGHSIRFTLLGDYRTAEGGLFPAGVYEATISSDGATFTIDNICHKSLSLMPVDDDTLFELSGVTIGVEFHWQRCESQRFPGELHLLCDAGVVWAINEVSLECYLSSVISSEMSATSSLELLKAHAVVSRSWLWAQLPRFTGATPRVPTQAVVSDTDTEIVRWYDRDDHTLFDVCADDHCQRYQGMTRVVSPCVAEAIAATRGEVLMYDGQVCDARFSKCCGGVTERFDACWGDEAHPYLSPIADVSTATTRPCLTDEAQASRFILSSPDAYCHTTDTAILSQVLNHYDRETPDFYRWQVRYGVEELSSLVYCRSGVDFGRILSLTPIERGASGRIVRLQIEGTRRTMTVGKELYIRRILSPTHLYSSAFVVERDGDDFVLRGAGWGHGVGLCQIGAAVMAHRGIDYRTILRHYYPATTLHRLYGECL